MEYTSGRGSTWQVAWRRAVAVLLPRRRRPGWSLFVPLIAMLAGLLFTTTARTAAGTALRDDRGPQLVKLIEEREQQLKNDNLRATRLREQNGAITDTQARSDSRIADQQSRAGEHQQSAGLTKLTGPGLAVRLDDAPRRPDRNLPPGARADDVVVHQQDVQSVVNALWAGGAEAMTIMGIRVISTSAVRCVGNTLLLHGQVFSPEFTIRAIGDPTALRAALEAAEGVRAFRDAARVWGLGYEVTDEATLVMPAYEGSTALDFAQVGD